MSNNNMLGSMQQMLSQFKDFQQAMTGKNPEAIVKQLLASGQMSQDQFTQLQGLAKSLQSFLR